MGVFPMFSRYEGFSHLFMRLLDDKLHRSFSFQGKRKILFYRYHAFNNNTPRLQEVMFFWQNCRCTLMLPFVFIFFFIFFHFWLIQVTWKGWKKFDTARKDYTQWNFTGSCTENFFNLLVWKCCFKLQQSHGQILVVFNYSIIQQQSDRET